MLGQHSFTLLLLASRTSLGGPQPYNKQQRGAPTYFSEVVLEATDWMIPLFCTGIRVSRDRLFFTSNFLALTVVKTLKR